MCSDIYAYINKVYIVIYIFCTWFLSGNNMKMGPLYFTSSSSSVILCEVVSTAH